jgi:YidC/Oxa1 family membrane protein insertase
MKNMPPAALEGPMAQQQKMLMYVFPLIFAFSGVNFPIGVLIYWTTTNLWSMGQQFYTIRKMPAPGSQAEAAMQARKAKKAAHRGVTIEEGGSTLTIEEARPVSGQRQQPVRKDRAKKSGGPKPAGTASAASSAPAAGGPSAASGAGTGAASGKGQAGGAAKGQAGAAGSGSGGSGKKKRGAGGAAGAAGGSTEATPRTGKTDD